MAEYGEFWCDICRAHFPDPLEELHRQSHAVHHHEPDYVALIAALASLALSVLALIIIFLNVQS